MVFLLRKPLLHLMNGTSQSVQLIQQRKYDYEGCLLYKGETVVNPYTGRKENVLTWTTVGYLLKDKGIIDFEETYECIKKIKEFVKKKEGV